MATDFDGIRVSARAIILREGKLLVQHYSHEGFSWSCTPGGGVDHGETLHEGLIREIDEELGIEVEIGALRYVRELRAATRERIFGNLSQNFHQLEHFFEIHAIDGEPKRGRHSDDCAQDIEWVDCNEVALTEANFYPLPLRKRLPQDIADGYPAGAVYLGDV